MTSWETFGGIFRDILIVYYFGNPVLFYSTVIIAFVVLMLSKGLSLQQSVVFSLPLVAVFATNGAFGSNTWVTAVILLVVAVIYAYAILDLFT